MEYSEDSLINFGLFLKRRFRLSDKTIEDKIRIIRNLLKKEEDFEDFIINAEVKNGTKNIWLTALEQWLQFHGIGKKFKRFATEQSFPYVPLEKDIDQFVSGFHKSKYAPLLQLLKETGCRLSEAILLTPEDFDFERKTVTINYPKKHGLPRQLRISNKLTAMIMPLIHKTDPNSRIWKAPLKAIKHQIRRKKKKLSQQLGNPNLQRISPKTFRHFKASMEYYKTKDIIHVKQILGHKSIKSTMIYTHLVNFESDEFHCATAKTIEEATDLIEAGFEYVTEIEGIKLFRKRE